MDRLPPEILERVMHYGKTIWNIWLCNEFGPFIMTSQVHDNLKNLRLVNKKLCDAATPHLFADHVFGLREESIEKLANIANDAKLCTLVNSLTFDTSIPRKINSWQKYVWIRNNCRSDYEGSRDDEENVRPDYEAHKQERDSAEACFPDNIMLRSEPQDLARALANLQRFNSAISKLPNLRKASVDRMNLIQQRYWRWLTSAIQLEMCPDDSSDEVLNIDSADVIHSTYLLLALSSASEGQKLESLNITIQTKFLHGVYPPPDVELGNVFDCIGNESLPDTDRTISSIKGAFKHLVELKLVARVETDRDCKHVAAFLQEAKHLEKLSLSAISSTENLDLLSHIEDYTWPKLNRLCLSGQMRKASLIALLTRHAAQIKALELSHMHIQDAGFPSLFKDMPLFPRLEDFCIQTISNSAQDFPHNCFPIPERDPMHSHFTRDLKLYFKHGGEELPTISLVDYWKQHDANCAWCRRRKLHAQERMTPIPVWLPEHCIYVEDTPEDLRGFSRDGKAHMYKLADDAYWEFFKKQNNLENWRSP